jgi:DNA-binding transcriptional LysR family regulator
VTFSDRIRRRLKLRDFDTIVAVAQCGSMAKAAVQLSVTQPAISKSIDEMEHVLGVRLFDRTSKGAEPTIYGRTMLKCASAIFDDVQQSVKEIEFFADPTAGELRVGATAPMFCGFLPAVFQQLHRLHPKIEFQAMEVSSPHQYRDLRERRIDLIVSRAGRQQPPDDVETQALFNEPLFVVAGPRSRWLHKRKVTLSELVGGPWALPPRDTIIGAFVAELFASKGLHYPRTAVACHSIEMQQALVEGGPFLAMLPGSVLHFGAKRLSVKKLHVDLPGQPPPVGIITLKKRTISPVAKIFIDTAAEVGRQLAKKPRDNRRR